MNKESRILAYIDKMPEAISGQNGHGATFNVALVLIHGFGLNLPESWPFMLYYNARCSPAWNQRELKHKLMSALQNPQKYRGKKLM